MGHFSLGKNMFKINKRDQIVFVFYNYDNFIPPIYLNGSPPFQMEWNGTDPFLVNEGEATASLTGVDLAMFSACSNLLLTLWLRARPSVRPFSS
jgi:hypothetical protein